MQVSTSDLLKLHDALDAAASFFQARDRMNAALHLAPSTRDSPLASTVSAALERVDALLEEGGQQ